MKKKLALLLAMCLAVGSLAGCGNAAQETETTPESVEVQEETDAASDAADAVEEAVTEAAGGNMAGKKVGFSPVMMSSEFFAGMSDQMEEYFTANGMEYTSADADASVETQAQNVENFVTMGMDYIILFAVDASAICDACIAAREAGAFVINIGTVLEQRDAYDVCINVDQYESGKVVAEMAADWIEKTFPDAEDGSIDVLVMQTKDTEDNTRRSEGLLEIENLCSKAHIAYITDQTQTDGVTKSQELAEAAFLEQPDIKCILAFGTDVAQGSNEIAMNKVENKDEFAIFTVDTPEFVRNLIKESATNDSLVRGTVMLGEGTPYTCYQLMEGSWMDRVEDGVYHEACIAITLDTMDQYFPE
ncbi:MAG: sugar ABC transporter substrate-binding protein [Lachnospiraceae bacterium]|nr:sugar ABC transporter substrate-binding protein [Lachnospiraceae bacterium]